MSLAAVALARSLPLSQAVQCWKLYVGGKEYSGLCIRLSHGRRDNRGLPPRGKRGCGTQLPKQEVSRTLVRSPFFIYDINLNVRLFIFYSIGFIVCQDDLIKEFSCMCMYMYTVQCTYEEAILVYALAPNHSLGIGVGCTYCVA